MRSVLVAGAMLLSFAGVALLGRASAEATEVAHLTLEELMRRMASTRGVAARFHEEKHLSLLEDPVENRGILHFVPPDCLSWHITKPGESVLIIEGKRVRFRDAASREDVDLSGNLIARHFVEGFMVLFNGDLDAMRRRYTVDFRADSEAWRLDLVPRSSQVRGVIDSIALAGRFGPPDRMVLLEAGGDWTITTFEQTEPDRPFTAAELHELFGPKTACGTS